VTGCLLFSGLLPSFGVKNVKSLFIQFNKNIELNLIDLINAGSVNFLQLIINFDEISWRKV